MSLSPLAVLLHSLNGIKLPKLGPIDNPVGDAFSSIGTNFANGAIQGAFKLATGGASGGLKILNKVKVFQPLSGSSSSIIGKGR